MRRGVGARSSNLKKGPFVRLIGIDFYYRMAFLVHAGRNIAVFYAAGIARTVETVDACQDTPFAARIIGPMGLFLWFHVLNFGRMPPYLGNAF